MFSKRPTLALLAVLLLLGAAFAGTSTLAQEEDDEDEEEADEQDDEDEEREEDEEKREVEIETEGRDVTISLERETEPREDKVEMTWKAEEAAFELEHESENETREVENKLEAKFGALAEYRDGNDNGRYDAGEEIVSGWVLGDDEDDDLPAGERAEWGTPSISDVTREGKDGKRITTTAGLGDAGELRLRFLVFGDFVELNGTSVSPTGAKIDIVVEDYAFQANGTGLALFLETESENEYEADVDDEDDETGVAVANRTGGDEVRLVFTWKDTAQVDGDSRSVETTVLEEETETESDDEESSTETERRFALSYPRGESIVHDPKAEVQMASAAGADVPAPGALALLATLAGLALAMARRRR